ncbi:hypothetical protein DACRYDRAFT_21048 [Dacryopinax primogenitus]|uniref:Uncharacterized protein n=1 Tax=Dacryopinax primogenitus (strain DJM 731) TaxID=1858805 RepID=M5G459_DACPD|nr:uncharacterized protein DACRYDRAFT_21048 [Dacryopinax primogenitus]EJU03464.1 hypothetical protein DACRYDRAFT_21048 [Dacryopinax primogenitus]
MGMSCPPCGPVAPMGILPRLRRRAEYAHAACDPRAPGASLFPSRRGLGPARLLAIYERALLPPSRG